MCYYRQRPKIVFGCYCVGLEEGDGHWGCLSLGESYFRRELYLKYIFRALQQTYLLVYADLDETFQFYFKIQENQG